VLAVAFGEPVAVTVRLRRTRLARTAFTAATLHQVRVTAAFNQGESDREPARSRGHDSQASRHSAPPIRLGGQQRDGIAGTVRSRYVKKP
jgi:hypothetical protein